MTRLIGRDPRTSRPIELAIHDGRIASIVEAPTNTHTWISAGFIDLQVNGYRGFDLNAEGLLPGTVTNLAHALFTTGVTTFFPTLITQSEDRLIAALRAIAAARQSNPLVARMVAGIHMEGPHISPQQGAIGAHPIDHVRPPSITEFTRWQQASGNLVKLVTLSPHWPESPAYIAELRRQGVHVSIGHTHATPQQIHQAADAGATLSTHLGNGVADPLPRHPNMIWAQLADDRLTAAFIADGHHLPTDTLKSMLRAKELHRTILVSDLAALGGLSPGRYTQPIGGDVELSADRRLNMAGTNFLAGAALPLKDGVSNLLRKQHMALADALVLVTANPGRFAGHRGQLKVGDDADITLFTLTPDHQLNIEKTFILGRDWTA